MQVDNISQYLQQIVHNTDNATKTANSVSGKDTKQSNSDKFNEYLKAFTEGDKAETISPGDAMKLYNLYSSALGNKAAKTRERFTYDDTNSTPLEVAQDAYADLLAMQADAISGFQTSSDSTTNELEEYIKSMQNIPSNTQN